MLVSRVRCPLLILSVVLTFTSAASYAGESIDPTVADQVTAAAETAPAPAPVDPAPAAVSTAPIPEVDASQYRIGGGDILNVQVFGETGLSGNFPVDDRGQMDFPLVGAVGVAGLTPAELATALRGRLMPGYIVNANVTVSVATYRSQPVQVLGAVAKPGVYFLRGPTNVLQVLSEAGGVARDGVNEVRLTHGGENGQVTTFAYDQLLRQRGGVAALSPGDIVFVPQSLVSMMGQVAKPGEVAYREGLTISQAVAAAGGALPIADLGRVYILRGDQRIQVNLRRILSGKAEDVPVKPGDRIFLGESAI